MGETAGSNGGNEKEDRAEAAPESRFPPEVLAGNEVGGLGTPLLSVRFDACRREKSDPSLLGDVPALGGAAALRDDGRLVES